MHEVYVSAFWMYTSCGTRIPQHKPDPTAKILIEAEHLPCVPYIWVYILYICAAYTSKYEQICEDYMNVYGIRMRRDSRAPRHKPDRENPYRSWTTAVCSIHIHHVWCKHCIHYIYVLCIQIKCVQYICVLWAYMWSICGCVWNVCEPWQSRTATRGRPRHDESKMSVCRICNVYGYTWNDGLLVRQNENQETGVYVVQWHSNRVHTTDIFCGWDNKFPCP